jgi:hypothetical protein
MPDISVALPTDSNGRRFQSVQGKLPAGIQIGSTNYANQTVVLVDAANNPLLVSVAHDAPDAGNGIKLQGRAVSTAPAAVGINDRVDAWFDTFGRLAARLCDQFGAALFSGPNAATDTFANPTTSSVLSHLMAWVPANAAWERVRSSGAGRLLVDGSGATQPVSGTVALGAGSQIVGALSGGGIMGATATTAIASTSADGQVVAATTSLRLMGFSFREDAGATASFILRHGTSTAGAPLAYVTLAPGESVRDWFGPQGKAAASGVFLDMISGTISGQVDTTVVA